MATIERIGKSPIQVFEGLTIDSIENEHKYLVNKHFVTPIKAELNSFEYDRTFNNVDILEGLKYETIENPHKDINAKANIKRIKPLKKYEQQIRHSDLYNNGLKY